MATQIQFRKDTTSNWDTTNPVLAAGEMGIDTDRDQFKIGDGVSNWMTLTYGGLEGPQGPKGNKGDEGEQGIQGIQGIQGPQGQGITIEGTVDTEADLPSGASAGDIYIAEDTGVGWVSDGAGDWTSIGQIQAEPLPEGTQGETLYYNNGGWEATDTLTIDGTTATVTGEFNSAQPDAGDNAFSVGNAAGQVTQGTNSVAVGFNAGRLSQGNNAVGVGRGAGEDNQAQFAVAVGYAAGTIRQSQNALREKTLTRRQIRQSSWVKRNYWYYIPLRGYAFYH